MARIVFVTLLVLVGVCCTMAQSDVTCGPNEVWKECGNSCLEPKCGQDSSGVACPLYCQARCECADGYCRDPSGQCVLQTTCGRSTKKH